MLLSSEVMTGWSPSIKKYAKPTTAKQGFYPDECQHRTEADRNTGSARTLYEYGIPQNDPLCSGWGESRTQPRSCGAIQAITSALNEILSQRTAACSSV